MNPPDDERFSTSKEDIEREKRRRRSLLIWMLVAFAGALAIAAIFYLVNSWPE